MRKLWEAEDLAGDEAFPDGGDAGLLTDGGGGPFAIGDVFAGALEGGVVPQVRGGDFGVVTEVAEAVVALAGVKRGIER